MGIIKKMPMPFPLIPVIAAGASLLGNAMDNSATAANNEEQRKWSEHMYERQRADALTDRDFSNNYNSPAAQMERLTNAGLNPNLVYGNGATQQPSSVVRGSNPPNYSPNPSRYGAAAAGISNSLMSMYDIEVKQAQTDNLKAQTDVAKQNALLAAANTAKVGVETASTGVKTEADRLNLDTAKQLQSTTIESAKAHLAKTYADTEYTLNQDERSRLLTNQSLAKGVQEIMTMRVQRENDLVVRQKLQAEINNMIKDGTLKNFEINMRSHGYTGHDNVVTKIVGDLLEGSNWKEKLEDFIKAPLKRFGLMDR